MVWIVIVVGLHPKLERYLGKEQQYCYCSLLNMVLFTGITSKFKREKLYLCTFVMPSSNEPPHRRPHVLESGASQREV